MIGAALEPELSPWFELAGGGFRNGYVAIPDWIGIIDIGWD